MATVGEKENIILLLSEIETLKKSKNKNNKLLIEIKKLLNSVLCMHEFIDQKESQQLLLPMLQLISVMFALDDE